MPINLAILNISNGQLSRGYLKYLSCILPELVKDSRILSILVVLPAKVNLCFSHPKINFLNLDIGFSEKHQINIALDMFVPNVIFIPTSRIFRYKTVPVVTMLQNMEPFQAPFLANPNSEKLKNMLRIIVSIFSYWFSDSTVAISMHVKKYLTRIPSLGQRYIPVIYHGVEPLPASLHSRPNSLPADISEFIFTAGSIRPARGLEDLVQAAKLLSPAYPRLSFVIAGSVDPGMDEYFRFVTDLIEDHGLSSRFIWLGPVDQSSIAWCFSNCKIFLMSSRTEACPNVVLESLAYGSIIVSALTDPMPEFYKDIAFYYHPSNAHSLENALNEALSVDSLERSRLQLDARMISASYTWENSAKSLAEFLCALSI